MRCVYVWIVKRIRVGEKNVTGHVVVNVLTCQRCSRRLIQTYKGSRYADPDGSLHKRRVSASEKVRRDLRGGGEI